MDDNASFIVCPECGMANSFNSSECMMCDRDLKDILLFIEDDFFDLEVTPECMVEYRKSFWGTRRTGKINKYSLDNMVDLEFGEQISRFKFTYNGDRKVLPLRDENMDSLKLVLINLGLI